MGFIQGRILIRENNGLLQKSFNDGATWKSLEIPGEITQVSVDSTDVDITGLNGDQDGDYILTGYCTYPNSQTVGLSIQPNQITANQNILIESVVAAGAPSTSNVASFLLSNLATDASGTPFVFFKVYLTALSGRIRRFNTELMDVSGVNNTIRKIEARGWWSDTSTVITSIRIHSTIASAIKAGSFFILQRTGVNS